MYIKIIFIGDIVGATGRIALKYMLPKLKNKYPSALFLANGENAAAGKGITGALANEFYNLGIHGLTMGNHTWDQKEIYQFIEHDAKIIRPANFPNGAPGNGFMTIKHHNFEFIIINLQGRTFLPPIDCPFQTVDSILSQLPLKQKNIFVDFHAEATSEKIAMGWHLDGRVTAMIGTHTHVQTNDQRILPKGTAYLTDVGMVGARDGVLGMQKEGVINKFITQLPQKFISSEGKWHFHATIIDMDPVIGKANNIQLLRFDQDEIWVE